MELWRLVGWSPSVTIVLNWLLLIICVEQSSAAGNYLASIERRQRALDATDLPCDSEVVVEVGEKYLFDSRSAIIYENSYAASQSSEDSSNRRRRRRAAGYSHSEDKLSRTIISKYLNQSPGYQPPSSGRSYVVPFTSSSHHSPGLRPAPPKIHKQMGSGHIQGRAYGGGDSEGDGQAEGYGYSSGSGGGSDHGYTSGGDGGAQGYKGTSGSSGGYQYGNSGGGSGHSYSSGGGGGGASGYQYSSGNGASGSGYEEEGDQATGYNGGLSHYYGGGYEGGGVGTYGYVQPVKPAVCEWSFKAGEYCTLESHIIKFRPGDKNCYKQQFIVSDNYTSFKMCGHQELYPAFRVETPIMQVKYWRQPYTYRHVFKGYVTCVPKAHRPSFDNYYHNAGGEGYSSSGSDSSYSYSNQNYNGEYASNSGPSYASGGGSSYGTDSSYVGSYDSTLPEYSSSSSGYGENPGYEGGSEYSGSSSGSGYNGEDSGYSGSEYGDGGYGGSSSDTGYTGSDSSYSGSYDDSTGSSGGYGGSSNAAKKYSEGTDQSYPVPKKNSSYTNEDTYEAAASYGEAGGSSSYQAYSAGDTESGSSYSETYTYPNNMEVSSPVFKKEHKLPSGYYHSGSPQVYHNGPYSPQKSYGRPAHYDQGGHQKHQVNDNYAYSEEGEYSGSSNRPYQQPPRNSNQNYEPAPEETTDESNYSPAEAYQEASSGGSGSYSEMSEKTYVPETQPSQNYEETYETPAPEYSSGGNSDDESYQSYQQAPPPPSPPSSASEYPENSPGYQASSSNSEPVEYPAEQTYPSSSSKTSKQAYAPSPSESKKEESYEAPPPTPPPKYSSSSPPPKYSSSSPPPKYSSTSPPPKYSSTSPPPKYSSTSPPPKYSSSSPHPQSYEHTGTHQASNEYTISETKPEPVEEEVYYPPKKMAEAGYISEVPQEQPYENEGPYDNQLQEEYYGTRVTYEEVPEETNPVPQYPQYLQEGYQPQQSYPGIESEPPYYYSPPAGGYSSNYPQPSSHYNPAYSSSHNYNAPNQQYVPRYHPSASDPSEEYYEGEVAGRAHLSSSKNIYGQPPPPSPVAYSPLRMPSSSVMPPVSTTIPSPVPMESPVYASPPVQVVAYPQLGTPQQYALPPSPSDPPVYTIPPVQMAAYPIPQPFPPPSGYPVAAIELGQQLGSTVTNYLAPNTYPVLPQPAQRAALLPVMPAPAPPTVPASPPVYVNYPIGTSPQAGPVPSPIPVGVNQGQVQYLQGLPSASPNIIRITRITYPKQQVGQQPQQIIAAPSPSVYG